MRTHKIRYEVLNGHNESETGRVWDIDVHATPEELRVFDRNGYLIREKVFEGEFLENLRNALDRLEAREIEKRDHAVANKESWGFFPRHLMDKDEAFLDLLRFEPTLSIAQAMMGPLVRVRGLSARISYPDGESLHQTTWHQHLRVISSPLPPWFSRPHCIDTLIYLDDLNDSTGPVMVVPGSHNWLDREAPHKTSGSEKFDSIDGEVELRVEAGGAVLIHGNLWHRALPTISQKRRVLILSYTPTWLRRSPHSGPAPDDGLTHALLETGDFEQKMLLGVGGYS